MAKITYEDKVKLQDEPDIPNKNKVTDNDMNEIKDVVNTNADELDTAKENIENLEEGQGTNSTDITNLKGRMTTLETDNAKNKSDISNLQKDNETNKTNISNLRNSKVDKIEGKGLSTEDFTTQLKTKLEGLENYNDTEIQEKIQTIEGKVQTLEDDNASNKANISTLQGKVTNLEKDNTTNKDNITNLQKDIEDLGKDIEENTVDISDLQAENKNLKEEVESYKNSLPRETQTGEYITMNNTADKVRFKDFVLGGNSKQESSEIGNNILCIDEFTGENGGLEQSYTEDILSLNGSRNNNISTVCEVKLYFKESGNYKILKKDISGNFSNGSIGIRAYNASEERLFFVQISNTGSLETSGEITEEMIKQISRAEIYTTTGAVFSDYKCKIMLTKESITEYEKFTPNRPSPKFPSKIENVEGNVEVTVANKNIANYNWAERFVNIVNNSEQAKLENVDGRRCFFWTANAGYKNDSAYFFKYMFKKNTRYVITFDIKPSTQNGNFVINYLDGTAGNRQNLAANTWQKITIISKANTTIEEIRPGYYSGQCYIDLDSVQIVEGTEEQDYVENEQQTVVFPLAQGQKLMLGDYLDDDGIHHKRKQVELNGTENWELRNVNADGIATFSMALTTKFLLSADIQALSTHYKYLGTVASVDHMTVKDIGFAFYHQSTSSSNKTVYINTTQTTLEEFKAFLAQQKTAGTPVILEYDLAEEEVEPYTEEQQEAYNKLKELTTYATQTNIYSTNNIKPVFTVTGIKDVNSLITQVNKLVLEGGN